MLHVAPTDYALIVRRAGLVTFIVQQGKKPSAEQRIQINRKREHLRKRVDEFHESFHERFPQIDEDVLLLNVPFGDDLRWEDDDEEGPMLLPVGDIEKEAIMLPSNVPLTTAGLQLARATELELRIAQADEALEGVRTSICHKSYLYRNDIAKATTKTHKLRSYDAVSAADREMRQYVRVYGQARSALEHLGASVDTLGKYQILRSDQLKAVKAVYEPNARGQSTDTLPWFWKLAIGSDSDRSAYLEECEHIRRIQQSLNTEPPE